MWIFDFKEGIMFDITSAYLKKELRKIAFFIQNAGLFDEFGVKIRRTLEDLPVEWDSVQTDGEIELSPSGKSEEGFGEDTESKTYKTWKVADLAGKLNDKPLKLSIQREVGKDHETKTNEIKRIKYTLTYDGKRYLVSSLSKLKDAVEKLSAGKVPKPKIMQMAYDLIQHRKAEIYTHIKRNFLQLVSRDIWYYKVSKDASRIYIRFYVKTDDPEKKQEIDDKLTEHDNYRLDSIGSYLETLIGGEGISGLTKENNMTHSLIKLSDQAGFVITIK